MKPVCLFCGEPEHVEIFEVFTDGSFNLDTCCGDLRDAIGAELADDPKAAARYMTGLKCEHGFGLEELCGHQLRRVVDDDGHLLLDFQLEVKPIVWADALAFIDKHHKHCEPPRGWRFGAAVHNGPQLIGVISVGRPVARAYDSKKVVEVNRLCVRRDVPRPLVWNACSLLYGWAAREAKKRGFERVITYTLESEPGTTLRAVGWKPEATVRARRRGWDTDSRPRDASRTPNVNKTRWARELRVA